MRSLNVGELVHEVTIQGLTDGVDASGAPLETWADLFCAWASREGMRGERGGEAMTGDQLVASQITRWIMRYDENLDPDLVDLPKTRRLVYRGRIYDIIEADPIDRAAGIELRTIASSRVEAA